jgi:predicted lipase
MPFQVSGYKTKLDQANAYWMAKMSGLVYLTRSATDQHPCEEKILTLLQAEDPGFISVTGACRNSAQAALIEHANYYCMAFRGTNELEDWIDNINAFSVKQLFGEFHRGFWYSVGDVWLEIFAKYEELNALKKKPLFLTGHSLGGAMATIAAAILVHKDLPFTSVYTFGQPRAMTQETARIFNVECRSRFFRFHNNNDMVTRVPSRVMGYSHVGTFLYISSEETIHEESGFWFRFLDLVDGAVEAVRERGLDGFEDHRMDKYLAAVTKWQLES